MPKWSRLAKIFIAGAVVLGVAVAWFFGNLFYSLFWALLAGWHVPVKEADMIAYMLAHFTPFAAVLLISASFYFVVRGELARATRSAFRAVLEMQFESAPPYQRTHNGCDAQWYFHLFNHGPSIAENVQVKLTTFSPEPIAELWKRIHLPYSVLPVNMTADMGGIRINPGHQEIFKVVRCAPSGTGAYVVWQFGQPANQHDQQFQMESHEQWALSYRVTAANSDEINFILVIFIQDNKLIVEKR